MNHYHAIVIVDRPANCGLKAGVHLNLSEILRKFKKGLKEKKIYPLRKTTSYPQIYPKITKQFTKKLET